MTHPTYGPVELVVLEFPQEQLTATVGDALVAMTAAGGVTILDLIHMRRSAGGYLETFEIDGLGTSARTDDVLDLGVAVHEDLDALAYNLGPGTSALVLVVEHTWSRTLLQAAESSGARLVTSEHIPVSAVSSLVKPSSYAGEQPSGCGHSSPPEDTTAG